MKKPQSRVTVGIAAATVVAYLAAGLFGGGLLVDLAAGFVPARVSGLVPPGPVPVWLTPLTATFVHANLMHLAFNMVMLVYCGREDEVALGGAATALLYVIGAYAAAACQYAVGPASMHPMVGASGAVSAFVGAYALLYGRRNPSRLPPEAARWLHVLWLAVAWTVIQFLVGIASQTEGMAIASAAHVGGFLAGVLLARPLLRWRYRHA